MIKDLLDFRHKCKECGNVTRVHNGISPSTHYMTIMGLACVILLLILELANRSHW